MFTATRSRADELAQNPEAFRHEFEALFGEMGVDFSNFDATFGGAYDLTGGQQMVNVPGVGPTPQAWVNDAFGHAQSNPYMTELGYDFGRNAHQMAIDLAGGSYQAGSPTLTVEQYIRRQDLLIRRMTDISEKGFIVDALLQGGFNVDGGSIPYTRSESIFLDGDPEDIPEGGPYPIAGDQAITPLVEQARKYGLKVFITEEMVRRNQFPQVELKVRKLTNNIIRFLDTLFLNRIINDPDIQTRPAAGAWNTASVVIDDDIENAKADIRGVLEGYEPDTLVLHPSKLPGLLNNAEIRQAYRGNTADRNPIFSGQLPPLFGLDLMWTPNLPNPNMALLMERKTIGGIGDEVPMETITLPFDHTHDRVWIKGRRVCATFLQEPKALVKITGI